MYVLVQAQKMTNVLVGDPLVAMMESAQMKRERQMVGLGEQGARLDIRSVVARGWFVGSWACFIKRCSFYGNLLIGARVVVCISRVAVLGVVDKDDKRRLFKIYFYDALQMSLLVYLPEVL